MAWHSSSCCHQRFVSLSIHVELEPYSHSVVVFVWLKLQEVNVKLAVLYLREMWVIGTEWHCTHMWPAEKNSYSGTSWCHLKAWYVIIETGRVISTIWCYRGIDRGSGTSAAGRGSSQTDGCLQSATAAVSIDISALSVWWSWQAGSLLVINIDLM